MNGVRHSIKKQYAIIFGVLFAFLVFLMCTINALVLGRSYIRHKKSTLITVYSRIDYAVTSNEFNTEEFEDEFRRIGSVNNLDIVILNSDMEIVLSTDMERNRFKKRILDYFFGNEANGEVLIKTSKYEIVTSSDPDINLEFIELWGMLSNGYVISIRTPIESIKESALIANRLTVLVGTIGLAVCVAIIMFITRRMTKPIMNLVNISERMTRLDFQAKYDKSGGDTEFDLLGDHINKLSSALESTISDLKSANVKLMKDIQEKTEIEERRKEFIANVSHELKTPIALIQGYAEGLKDCVNDDEESREFYCDVIVDEAQKMNGLVKNLLELDQIESGAQETITEHFDIIEVIYNCAESMNILWKQNDIKMILPDRSPIMVWADEFKIEQIINNYLSNAIHYTKGDKIVRISASVNDNVARISVFNTGDNIPEDSIDRLWNKFYKVDKARTREYGGSGIGLSIVKAIMESTGQKYGVTNCEGGVEFWFEADASAGCKCFDI